MKEKILELWPAFATLLATLDHRHFYYRVYFHFRRKGFWAHPLALPSPLFKPDFPPLISAGDLCLGTTVSKSESRAISPGQKRRRYGFPCFPRLGGPAASGNRPSHADGDPFFRPLGGISGQFLYRPDNFHNSDNATSRGTNPRAIRKSGSYFHTPLFCLDDG